MSFSESCLEKPFGTTNSTHSFDIDLLCEQCHDILLRLQNSKNMRDDLMIFVYRLRKSRVPGKFSSFLQLMDLGHHGIPSYLKKWTH